MTPTLTKEYFTAPVDEGEVGGNIVVTYKGQSLGTYDLVTRNSVSRSNILYVFDVLKSLARTTQFKVILAIAAAMAVGYVGVLVYLALPKKPKNIRGRQGTPNRHGRSGGNRPGAAPRNGGVNYQRPNRPGTSGGNRPSNGQRPVRRDRNSHSAVQTIRVVTEDDITQNSRKKTDSRRSSFFFLQIKIVQGNRSILSIDNDDFLMV